MKKQHPQHLQKNWFEWAVFSVALVLVAGTLGFLAYDAVTTKRAPARLEVRLGTPQRVAIGNGTHYNIPVTVLNSGMETAEGVQVEVQLSRPGHDPARAGFEVAFMPRQSQRTGAVTFATDPRQGTLTARALGYEKP